MPPAPLTRDYSRMDTLLNTTTSFLLPDWHATFKMSLTIQPTNEKVPSSVTIEEIPRDQYDLPENDTSTTPKSLQENHSSFDLTGEDTLVALKQFHTIASYASKHSKSPLPPLLTIPRLIQLLLTQPHALQLQIVEQLQQHYSSARQLVALVNQTPPLQLLHYTHGKINETRQLVVHRALETRQMLTDHATALAHRINQTPPLRLLHYTHDRVTAARQGLVRRTSQAKQAVLTKASNVAHVVHDQTVGRLVRSGPYQWAKGYTDMLIADVRVAQSLHRAALCDSKDGHSSSFISATSTNCSLAPLNPASPMLTKIGWRTRRLVYALARLSGQSRRHLFQRSFIHWPLDSVTLTFQLLLLYLPTAEPRYDAVRESLQDCLRWYETYQPNTELLLNDPSSSSSALDATNFTLTQIEGAGESLDASFLAEITAASSESPPTAIRLNQSPIRPTRAQEMPSQFESTPTETTSAEADPSPFSLPHARHNSSNYRANIPSGIPSLQIPDLRSPTGWRTNLPQPRPSATPSNTSHTSHQDSISSLDSIGQSHAHAVYTRALEFLAREGVDLDHIAMSSDDDDEDRGEDADEDDLEFDRYSNSAKIIQFGENASTPVGSSSTNSNDLPETETDSLEDELTGAPTAIVTGVSPNAIPPITTTLSHLQPPLQLSPARSPPRHRARNSSHSSPRSARSSHRHQSSAPDVGTILETSESSSLDSHPSSAVAASTTSPLTGQIINYSTASTNDMVQFVLEEEPSTIQPDDDLEVRDLNEGEESSTNPHSTSSASASENEPGWMIQTPEGKQRSIIINSSNQVKPKLNLPVRIYTNQENYPITKEFFKQLYPILNHYCSSHAIHFSFEKHTPFEWNLDEGVIYEEDTSSTTTHPICFSLSIPSTSTSTGEVQSLPPIHFIVQGMYEHVDATSLVRLLHTIVREEKVLSASSFFLVLLHSPPQGLPSSPLPPDAFFSRTLHALTLFEKRHPILQALIRSKQIGIIELTQTKQIETHQPHMKQLAQQILQIMEQYANELSSHHQQREEEVHQSPTTQSK